MGAWGYSTFENDDALDWAAALEEDSDARRLTAAFEAVIQNQEYLESFDCSAALAAAEVVAACRGRAADSLPEEILAFLDRVEKSSVQSLRENALTAIERVRSQSELQELWQEADLLADWTAAVDALRARLA